MLAKELPELLQNLLIVVERIINRIPLEDLPIGYCNEDKTYRDYCYTATNEKSKLSRTGSTTHSLDITLSPKCGLRRQDLITKNKQINTKYTLRRMSAENGRDELSILASSTTQTVDAIGSRLSMENECVNREIMQMPLFCLGGSFPHIDSDEESDDDIIKTSDITPSTSCAIKIPKSIKEVPEKLLTSGICIPGTNDLNGSPIITIEAEKLITAGVNGYEIATVLLYYSTIPLKEEDDDPDNSVSFTIHIIMNDHKHLSILNLIDTSLHQLNGQLTIENIIISCLYERDETASKIGYFSTSKLKYKYIDEPQNFMSLQNLSIICGGHHKHNQKAWIDFFTTIEPIRNQCLAAGRHLVSTMNDVRSSDNQSTPTKKQLYLQQRTLHRALIEPGLQNLRRKSKVLQQLQTLANECVCVNSANNIDIKCNSVIPTFSNRHSKTYNEQSSFKLSGSVAYANDHVSLRLREVVTIFDEIDRAARRLEQLLEDRRNRITEFSRQKTLEKMINEFLSWTKMDGNDTLTKFETSSSQFIDDGEKPTKDCKEAFEKFYKLSMDRLTNANELQESSQDIATLKDAVRNLKEICQKFGDRLEIVNHRLINSQTSQLNNSNTSRKDSGVCDMTYSYCMKKGKKTASTTETIISASTTSKSSLGGSRSKDCSKDTDYCSNCSSSTTDNLTVHDDEDDSTSKIADSGLGTCCDRCEKSAELRRTCSCQSFDYTANGCNKSNNSDELEDDCLEENPKQELDFQLPMQPNAHLYCSELSFDDFPEFEHPTGIDAKTQKTLLFIMREMIGTERDYVRSLHYIIESYISELNREDIPQALRGQRNVIFGNVEKIFDFHQQHFLRELEQCERNPLKVGAAFLEHESKFYLYALYNKNKPKSDELMSEYGSNFFKSKQLELEDKMDLASYLLKPVQRMGKYALLLQQLKKAVTSVQGPTLQEICEDVDELQKAEEMVRFQLRHGNDLLAMDSLRECDVNVKEQGRLLRQNEFFVWQGRGGRKTIRQVFLFEELLLFSKARRFPDSKNLDIYLYKNSIKTSDIGLTAHTNDSPTTKFEIWFRKRKPDDTWILQSTSEETKNVWTDEISKLLWKQAKRNRDVRLAEMSSMGIGNKPCLDIRPSQNQINDRSITLSQLEKAPKLRHSMSAVTMPETKPTPTGRRPNSVNSLGSSFSSGTSMSSISTSTTASSNGSNNLSKDNDEFNIEAPPICVRKCQRSSTLKSQISLESGIIADIASPESELSYTTLWPSKQNNNQVVTIDEQNTQ